MNIKEIRDIINAGLNDEQTESLIIQSLSKDPKIIPTMLEILDIERKAKKELISDMNLELSRTHIYIEMNKECPIDKTNKKFNQSFTKNFVVDKVAEFYFKYKNQVTHCFNRFNHE